MTPLKLAVLGVMVFGTFFGLAVAWGYSQQPKAPMCATDEGWRYGDCVPG